MTIRTINATRILNLLSILKISKNNQYFPGSRQKKIGCRKAENDPKRSLIVMYCRSGGYTTRMHKASRAITQAA